MGAVVHCYTDRDDYEVEVLDRQGRTRDVVTPRDDQLLRLNVSSLVA